MPMTIYKLWSDQVGDSVASLDVQLDGNITSILLACQAGGVDVLNEGVSAEVSFLSSNTISSNDVRGSLMAIQSRLGAITTGGMNTAQNISVSTLYIPVNAGERIHLHIEDIGTLASRTAFCYLYVEDKGTGRTAGRRR